MDPLKLALVIVATLASVACGLRVTRIGALAGRWSIVEGPSRFTHFRGVFVRVAQEPWLVGIEYFEPGHFDPPDTGPVTDAEPDVVPIDATPADAGAPPDAGDVLHIHGGVMVRAGEGWKTLTLDRIPNGLWVGGSDDVWLAGTNSIDRTDGGVTPSVPLPTGWTDLRAVFGPDGASVWTAGNKVLRWDGSRWQPQPLDGDIDRIHALWGTSDRDLWAVGEASVIHHFTGAWSGVRSGVSSALRGVWGSGPRDVWVVGDHGAVLHYDGDRWRTVASSTAADVRAVWGSAADDVWMVGAGGTILHWNGAELRAFPSPTGDDLISVHGTGPDDVWAVGDRVVLRFER